MARLFEKERAQARKKSKRACGKDDTFRKSISVKI